MVSRPGIGIGSPVRRVEDERFLTGRGRYADDLKFPGIVYGYVVRSPHAHAKIRAVDTTAVENIEGVLCVLTGRDVERETIGPLPCLAFPNTGASVWRPLWPVLATDYVRFVGQAVAFVVAESVPIAKDAAENLRVDYEALAPANMGDVIAATAPPVWPDVRNNIAFEIKNGDGEAVQQAIDRAAHVTHLEVRYPRVSANAIEPRAAVACPDSAPGRTVIYSSTQTPFRIREVVSRSLNLPELALHVIAYDVGGGFGMKSQTYPEDVLVTWACRRLGRPVKWTAERGESLAADAQGRDQVAQGELAFDADGRMLALRVRVTIGLGAYLALAAGVAPMNAASSYTGVYKLPAIQASVRGAYTHTAPVAPYRGTAKPEASFFVERIIDKAAREMKRDPIELRRINLIPASAMPHRTAEGHVYDCGEFEQVLDKVLVLANRTGFAARRAESEHRGLLRGFGLAMHCQRAGNQSERMEIRVSPDGYLGLYVGTYSHGQGHETTFAQLASEWFGVDLHRVRVFQGDTDQVLFGRGTFSQRSMLAGGSALRLAADVVIAKAKRVAGWMLETAEADIEFSNGNFAVKGTDRRLSFDDVVRKSYQGVGLPAEFDVGLDGTASHPGPNTFPNGCMVAEVEVNAETGAIAVVRLSAADDAGVVLNPLLIEGQLHGSSAQGIGEALLEEVVYDPSSGQLITGSFMDYAMPRASDMPLIASASHPVPTKTNPLGAKGGSEAGNVGVPAAVSNAIIDALSPFGITDIKLPARAEEIWRAIRDAQHANKSVAP
ncbi:MAG TPA: xanthine dehydrogenase family protein molybdopterin-binding subunit [Stellaceae bacterium]|nr:xanthine dehydrogenase family protein molybdopterin-binding subunit [Stellaceae bacterium]